MEILMLIMGIFFIFLCCGFFYKKFQNDELKDDYDALVEEYNELEIEKEKLEKKNAHLIEAIKNHHNENSFSQDKLVSIQKILDLKQENNEN